MNSLLTIVQILDSFELKEKQEIVRQPKLHPKDTTTIQEVQTIDEHTNEINELQSMDRHAPLSTLEMDRKQSLAEETQENKVSFIEQRSLDRSSTPTFIPEVIYSIRIENMTFSPKKLGDKFEALIA